MSGRSGGRGHEDKQRPGLSASSSQRGRGRGRGGRTPGSGSRVPMTPSPMQTRSMTQAGSSSSASGSATSQFPPARTPPVATQTPAKQQTPPATLPIRPPPPLSKDAEFPPRPSLGKLGMKCLIRANHFLVELADKDLHLYDVAIIPEMSSRGVNRAIMKQLVEMHGKTDLSNRKPAYDGRKGMYTAGPLPFSSKNFSVKLVGDSSGRKEREFTVTIRFAAKADLHHLQQFLRSRQRDVPQETIQALDVVLRDSPSNRCIVVGRSFFSASGGKREIGNGVECWTGFYQSLRPTQMGMSLNMDVSTTSFYESITVLDFVAKFLRLDLSRPPARPLSDNDCAKLKKVLKGVRIEVTHVAGKRYKISGVSSVATNRLMFFDSDKKQKSVAQYFQEKYKIRLQYDNLQSLQSGSDSKPIYLPMELCKIVEGQRYPKKLNEYQVVEMLKAACSRPNERATSIQEIVNLNNYGVDPLVSKEFGLAVKPNMTTIDARILPAPAIRYHPSGRDETIVPNFGKWNMMEARMYKGSKVRCWMCANFSNSVNDKGANDFCRQLANTCIRKGMDFNPTPVDRVWHRNASQIEKTLYDIYHHCTNNDIDLELLLIILPDVSGFYGKIKRVCETEIGIISQCCQPKQARKCNPQYLENVVLKINVKTEGVNAVLADCPPRKVPFYSEVPTIIFGADVTHPSPGEDSGPSIAAVVAAVDWPYMSTYKAVVSAQGHREEIIRDLYKYDKGNMTHSGMIRELLVAFFNKCRYRPQRIIFYRDGVSEGQFNQVLLQEIDAIRKACASMERDYLPSITFVVVQKRHHTRFFPTDPRKVDKSGNIMPGTVVDAKICHPTEYDFYLCSHAGLQGTSRPVRYSVIYDENKFPADHLQTLTNNLCYTYARCTRSVSLVPPAYYAHLAAFRARYYIEGDEGPANVSSSGRAGRREAALTRGLPTLKGKAKECMFFI